MSIQPADAKKIFLEAVEKRAPGQRSEFLTESCRDDQSLRQRVEALLDAHEQFNEMLDGEGVLPTVDLPIAERAGSQIGPYKLLQEIGHGGMGVVYMAEQSSPVQRRVALKIIKPGMDTRQVIARFEAERQALAMMDHPNIAKVLDAGATESGRPYFVMELVNGVPATEYCDEQHLSPQERLELFLPICQAVQHAHQKGVIHRDLKPSNVLVALYDGQPVPKVIDFGVAKATTQSLTEKTLFTQLGQIIGTLEYMSPEQAQRNQLDIDTRSDVYSLGVLLYELLTGTTPFEKKRLRNAAFEEILRIIRDEEPPRPSTRLSSIETLPSIAANRRTEPKKLSSVVRGELDWIVMKALEKDRARRYETAQGFADDVQRYLKQETVHACPPSMVYQVRKFVRRHRGPVAAGFSLVLLLVAGVLGTGTGWMNATVARDDARAAEAEAVRERAVAEEERRRAEAAGARESRLRSIADEQSRRAELNRYVSDISLAHLLLKEGNLADAKLLLKQYIEKPHLLSFEWWFLWDLCQREAVYSESLQYDLRSLAVSPKGNMIATISVGPDRQQTSRSSELSVYTTNPLQKDTTLRQYGSTASYLAFSPDGEALIVGNQDGSIDLRTGDRFQETHPLGSVHTKAVSAITFSPRGDVFATGAGDGQIALWNYSELAEVDRWENPEPDIYAIAFSHDGKTLAVSGHWDTVTLINTLDGTQRLVKLGNGFINSVAFSPTEDNLLAMGCHDCFVRFLDIDTGEVSVVGKHLGSVSSVAFLPDGKTVVSTGRDSPIRLWERQRERSAGFLMGHTDSVLRAVPSPDGSTIYSIGNDKKLKAWSSSPTDQFTELRDEGMNWVRETAFTADGQLLVSGGFDGMIRLWDLRSCTVVHTFRGFADHSDPRVFEIAFHPTDDFVAIGNRAGEIKILDLRSHETVRAFQAHDNRLNRLEFSPDGTYLVSTKGGMGIAPYPGEVKLWKYTSLMQGAEPEARLIPLNRAALIFAITPDSQLLVTGAEDGVALWDLHSLQKVHHLADEKCHRMVVSSDGKLLAANQGDDVLLWDLTKLESTEPIGRFPGIGGNGLAFTNDSRTLAAGTAGHEISLWNVATRRQLMSLPSHNGFVEHLTFSHDGSILASASADDSIRLWHIGRLASINSPKSVDAIGGMHQQ